MPMKAAACGSSGGHIAVNAKDRSREQLPSRCVQSTATEIYRCSSALSFTSGGLESKLTHRTLIRCAGASGQDHGTGNLSHLAQVMRKLLAEILELCSNPGPAIINELRFFTHSVLWPWKQGGSK